MRQRSIKLKKKKKNQCHCISHPQQNKEVEFSVLVSHRWDKLSDIHKLRKRFILAHNFWKFLPIVCCFQGREVQHGRVETAHGTDRQETARIPSHVYSDPLLPTSPNSQSHTQM